MSRRESIALLCAVLCGACAAKSPPVVAAPTPEVERRHRPRWVQTVEADVDAIVRCLDGRETPAYVLFVHHDPERLTSMTTADGFGALEHCVVGDGAVLVRRPAVESLRDFEGLPLFSLGSTPPAVPPMTVLEEIGSEGSIFGWLHWPRTESAINRSRADGALKRRGRP